MKKKKRGFTLIELLAVIVILAIIALIATPIVMNVIENSRKGAAERSAENYLRAVETAIASERIDGPVTDGAYEVDENGDLVLKTDNTIKIEVEVSGNAPASGTVIVIVNGVVDKTQVIIVIGDYSVRYNTEGKIEASITITVYRRSEDTIRIGDTIDPTAYTTDPQTLGKSYYLKHVLDKDNKVIESYACADYKNAEEMCIRGGSSDYYGYAENEADYTGNVLVLYNLRKTVASDYAVYKHLSYFGGITILQADSKGEVFVYNANDNTKCKVTGTGISKCES